MRRLVLAAAALLLVQSLSAQLAADPAPGDLGDPFALAPAPMSTKIWDDFSWPNLSSKAHRALGYATVTLGAAAWLSGHYFMEGEDGEGSGGEESGVHGFLGRSAGILAGTNALLGLVGHWDKLSFSGELLTWHNLHGLAAGAGTASMAAAALIGGREAHDKFGLAGTLLMALAIVLEG